MDARRVHAALAAVMLLVSAAAARGQSAGGYTLGSGLPLGASGIRLGGYITVDAENPDNEVASLTFDDLSVFVFGDLGPRIQFFAEAEETHFWQITSNGDVYAANNADLERLYVDYLHRDTFKLRTGKFLTPVGTWNEIHPDPLTWTVSRPLASFATFPAFTTGVQAYGTWSASSADVDYNVFAQYNDALDNSTGDRFTERMIGGRVRARLDALEIGVPVVRYIERDTGDAVTFSGADLLGRLRRLEVRAELTAGRVRSTDGFARAEFAAYLQGLVSLTDRSFLVARQERAHSRDDLTFTATSIGYLFRPKPAMSLKGEWQARSGRFFATDTEAGNQFLASFGVLF